MSFSLLSIFQLNSLVPTTCLLYLYPFSSDVICMWGGSYMLFVAPDFFLVNSISGLFMAISQLFSLCVQLLQLIDATEHSNFKNRRSNFYINFFYFFFKSSYVKSFISLY